MKDWEFPGIEAEISVLAVIEDHEYPCVIKHFWEKGAELEVKSDFV